jgi:hypothetical protein
MGEVIGQLTTGQYSTWAQLRCPLIDGYNQWNKYVGPGPQYHNLVVDSGYHPDDGLFLRVNAWPSTSFWLDTSSNPHTEYSGPIVGFQDGGGVSPYDSYFSVGAYDAIINDLTNPSYTSVNNNLDSSDITNSLVGLTVTYSGGTFTTTADAFDNTQTTLWFGQSIGYNVITSVSDIDTFTAF